MKTENEELINSRISELIERETPFAVIQFFENLISNPQEKYKKYEIMYIGENIVMEEIDNKTTEVVHNVVKFEKFTRETEIDFSLHNDKFTLVRNNKYGRVWEFGNFKEYKKTMIKE